MGRRIVLGVVGAAAAAVCAFVVVVLVRGGLAEAGLWAGVAGGLAGVVGAAVTVGLAVPRHAVPPDPRLPGPPNTPGRPPSPEAVVPRQLPKAVAGFAGRAGELEKLTSLLDEAARPGGTVPILAIDGTAGVGKTALADARELLIRRLGADRVEAYPQAVQQIIARCAGLPLALAIVAARAAENPHFPLTDLAEELRDEEGAGVRLQALDAGEAAASVIAVFSWSYRRLSDPAARLFRLLSLHPGPDITAPAAASLAAVPLADAQQMLTSLARDNLINEQTPGRYTFHELLRAYASAQTRDHDPGTDQDAAKQRMLDHYLHSAQAAWSLSYPHQQQDITLAPPLPGVAPEKPADHAAARAWFTAEYPVLLAVIQVAADTGHPTHAWQLPHTLVPFFERQGHWHDFAATHRIALAATQGADQQGQAYAQLRIGQALARAFRPEEARPQLTEALRLFEGLGDLAGQSDVHFFLGITCHRQEQNREALAHMQQAVDLARAHGAYRPGLAAALNGLGWVHAVLGDSQEAIPYSQDSLDLFRELGDRWGEAATLDTIGYAYRDLGDYQQAVRFSELALDIDRELGDPYSEAIDADHLGDALNAVGKTAQARRNWLLALDIFDQLSDLPSVGAGYASPEDIRAKLRSAGA